MPDPPVPTQAPAGKTLLLISQVYVPDPASVGQHMHDAAAAMARRGWRVRVLTSARGYEDPSVRYPLKETRDGVEVRRIPLGSFGKRSIPVRLLGAASFLSQVLLRGLFVPRLDAILVSTSPPMASAAAVVIGKARRAPITYWAMDLNPDQMIALGKARESAWPVRVFEFLNRLVLRHARAVVALDRFMADRLERKAPVGDRLAVLPPWAHEEHLEAVPHDANPFRKKHGLDGKFVFMYSGNMSLASPLDTFLQAALRVQDDDRLRFVFIGGGGGKKAVDELIARRRPRHMLSLPYQPLDQIKYSLSAADVHLVSMGESMVGIIHPCKIYGAMAVARPALVLGPAESHLSDIVAREGIGWRVAHGDVDGAAALFRRIAATDPAELAAMGRRASEAVRERYASSRLCEAFCDTIERGASRVSDAGAPAATPARGSTSRG